MKFNANPSAHLALVLLGTLALAGSGCDDDEEGDDSPTPDLSPTPVPTPTPVPEPTPTPVPCTTPTPGDTPDVNDGSIITTVAGSGDAGCISESSFLVERDMALGNDTGDYGGDGGNALEAKLDWPTGVVVDPAGNVYIADTFNQRVRKVAPDGVITTFAGTGETGDEGEGIDARLATFDWPGNLTLDGEGNLYIVDAGNGLIRKVDPEGIITTVAGTREDTGSLEGPATECAMLYPTDVAVDAAGNLYIAEFWSSVIRKVDTDGDMTIIAGIYGEYGYSGDGGRAIDAHLNGAGGVAVDSSGQLFIADNYNNVIRKINAKGIITTVAGTGDPGFSGDGGPATAATLNWPSDLAINAIGELYFSDTFNQRIRVLRTDGTLETAAGNGYTNNYGLGYYGGDGGSALQAYLNDPYALAFDTQGALYIANSNNNRVRKVAWEAK